MQSPNSILNGKSALFCGDSISFGSNDRQAGGAWAGRIAKYYNMQVNNVSQSGWSLSTIREGQIVEQLHTAEKRPYDYVILHGGVNDAWGDGTVYALPGKIAEDFAPSAFDVNTYAGALEELFYYAYRYFPGAKIGYIINFATPGAAAIGHLGDMEPYYSLGLEICRKWGIPCLDLYHDSYVNDTLLQVTGLQYMSDAVHPNAAGYDRLAPYVAAWMETMPENHRPVQLD